MELQIDVINNLINDKKTSARKIRVELMKLMKMVVNFDDDIFMFIESTIQDIADRKAVEKLTNAMNNIEAQISSIS